MGIIKNSWVFDSTYIPKEIPVRQGLVDKICAKLRISSKYNLLLTGLTGNGKTITIKKVIEKMGKEIIAVYIDCSESNSYGAIAKTILGEVKNKSYKEKGKSRYELADDLKKLMLTKRQKKLVFVFDEIDKLIKKKDGHWDVLFPLLNHGKASFIFISNDGNILGKLDKKIFSRLSAEKIFLDVYSPNEVYDILKQRVELGLEKGSYENEILFKIAKFSSEVSGDIRFALKLLEKIAIVTELDKQSKISEETIKKAIEEMKINDIDEIFLKLPRHMKIVLVALCMEARQNMGYAITTKAYKTYVFNAKKEQFGAVGERQFRDYLSSLDMLGLFEFQWKPATNRRGRVRIAIPTFDYLPWLEENFLNNGDARGGRWGGLHLLYSVIL